MTDDKDRIIADLQAELTLAEHELDIAEEDLADAREELYLSDAERDKAERVADHLHERLDTVSEAAMAVLVMAERQIQRSRCDGPFLGLWDTTMERLRTALSKEADTTPAGIAWELSGERVANVARALGLPEGSTDSAIMEVADELGRARGEQDRAIHLLVMKLEAALDKLEKIKAAALRYLDDVTLGEGDDALEKALMEFDRKEDELRALCADEKQEADS